MKILFPILLGLHALIHFMGTAKALKPQLIPQLNRSISGPEGIFWFLAGLLLLVADFLYLFKQPSWPIFTIVGALLSQFLISLNWEDAKYATVLNLFFLAVTIPAIGQKRFSKMVSSEVATLITDAENSAELRSLDELPEVVQKWLKNSGAVAISEVKNVKLEQRGKMRTSPNGRWMQFSAVEYFSIPVPGFVWQTKVDAYPGIDLYGRDKLHNGNGEMLIKLFSLFPVANEKGNEKVNTGSLLRFLGEICWFPAAARAAYIDWKTAGPTSAVAELTWNGKNVYGTFNFSPSGDLVSFEALRYYGSGKNARPERWHISILQNAIFEGVLVPAKCRVTWKMADADFDWMELEIISLKYNVSG